MPKIGRMPISDIGQPEVLQILSPICTVKHETARRVAQRMKAPLDVARSRGHR
ncbi:phage integrase central domain-containing protein [Salipiger thiooxidans]|uniref:phage integrase central domain-containing protein n=1 Tax=Salipiger thiooxidans TaxID=282683 RepID=UPI0035CB83AF